MLRTLSGRVHEVFTGLALVGIEAGVEVTGVEVTHVEFRPLTDEEIEQYCRLVNVMDKAGAYAIQGPGALVVRRIKGCYYNVVGLPVGLLEELLHRLGLSLFQYAQPSRRPS